MGGTVPHEQANLAHTARGDTLLAAFGDEMRRHIDRWRPEPEEYEAEAPPVIHFASYADTMEATSATPTNPTPAKKYTGRQTRIKLVVTKKTRRRGGLVRLFEGKPRWRGQQTSKIAKNRQK